MSWSVGFKGTKDVVLKELREQIHNNDGYCQQPAPQGMSDAENQIRRQAQTLLYGVVLTHNVPEGAPAWIASTVIEARASGSESRDASGASYQTLNLSVSVSKP